MTLRLRIGVMKMKGKPAAVFVDAENQSDLDVGNLLQQLQAYDVVENHAFGDWRNPCLEPISQRLECHGFEMHYTRSGPRPGARKNTADGSMERGIMTTLRYCPQIRTIILVTGDGYFVRATQRLQETGRSVIVAADPMRISHELLAAANGYLPIGELANSVQALYHLQRSHRYITFRFAMLQLGLCQSELSRMIDHQFVIQSYVPQPDGGRRREIWLNVESPVVQRVLAAA